MPAIADLVHQTSATTGTGSLTLAAVNGKRSFDSIFGHAATTNFFYYFISNRNAAEWEYGTGHMSDATTLVRDTVIFSSNSNSAVSFTAGTLDVANDLPASMQDIHAATGKTTPVDADELALIDSAASNVLKKLTWANLKATLKTYLDTLYQPLASALTSWAAITRASGFDTFATTPSSANLKSLVTDETGSGGALVFATSPTLTTPDITIAKAITETPYTITDGAAFAIDPTNGAVQVVTLGANRTPVVANFGAGQSVLLGIDDGTARTVTWTTIGLTWITDTGSAPTLATTGYTWILLWKIASTIYGARAGNNA